MKAVGGDLPTGEDWIFELKWDGMRLGIRVEHGEIGAFSSNGKDATTRFPELAGLVDALHGLDAVLDAEVVAFDDSDTPSFERLQHRMHVASAAEAIRRRSQVPVVLAVFDLLELDGTETIQMPWQQRRTLLDQVLTDGPHWRLSRVHEDGDALFESATEKRLEGVMAKRVDSTYQPGRRSHSWRKVKIRRHQELVVGGWARGRGSRSNELGSLAVGYFDEDRRFRFAGRVGSGLTSNEAAVLESLLEPMSVPRCRFDPEPPRATVADMHWVEPELVVEIAFAEWTSDGRLRHPTYLGRRDDVEASEVVREP